MLKITIRDARPASQELACLILEGRIIGEWVPELKKTWIALRSRVGEACPIKVELNAVSYISQAGASQLCEMSREGARLISGTPLMLAYIEEIRRFDERCRSKESLMERQQKMSSAKPKPKDRTIEPSREAIAVRAYEIWMQEGRTNGRHTQHWLEAEKQLRENR